MKSKNLFYIIVFFIASQFLLATTIFAELPSKIISLAPNMTEILFTMGLGDRIVGVTNFCDYPDEAKKNIK